MTFASIHITLKTAQHGRVFVPYSKLAQVELSSLQEELGRTFADQEDQARQHLIAELLHYSPVDIEIFRDEDKVVCYHCYIKSRVHPQESFFACVLARTSFIEKELDSLGAVYETSTFQYIGDLATPATLQAGLEAWVSRVWPSGGRPMLRVKQIDV